MKEKRKRPYLTYGIIAVNILMCLLIHYGGLLDATHTAILLGAFYKPMILCGEYWRLLTVGFIHIQPFHLLMNLYSFYILGRMLEIEIGRGKYAVILSLSVIGGSLFQLTGSENRVCVGLSGGLYGLMAAMFYLFYLSKAYKNPLIRNYIERVLILNLGINLMPQVAWKAHLGGFVFGLALSVMLLSREDKKELARNTGIAFLILCVALCFGIMQTRSIKTDETYTGTDVTVLRKEKELGFSQHAEVMAKRLDDLYNVNESVYELLKGE